MEKFTESGKFNELQQQKQLQVKSTLKLKRYGPVMLPLTPSQTSGKFDLKCRTNLFGTGFMASFSFSKFAEDVREKRR